MENLKEKISADYITAFKAKETVKKNLLGVIKAAITSEEQKPGNPQVGDKEILAVLKSVRKGIAEVLEKTDSAEAKEELAVVDSYLPQQMSEQEVRTAIAEIISETGAKTPADMGKVMSGFKAKHDGKADGKLVSIIVKEELAKITA